ncbi:hypothetical protein AQ721_14905 [Burkholderia pseudomallei]|nr:hypothetical protein AQ721_14905 [Burkholderia pseudomallei]
MLSRTRENLELLFSILRIDRINLVAQMLLLFIAIGDVLHQVRKARFQILSSRWNLGQHFSITDPCNCLANFDKDGGVFFRQHSTALVEQVLLQAAEPAKLIQDVRLYLRARATAKRCREHKLPDAHAAIARFPADQSFLVVVTPYWWKRAGPSSLFARTHFHVHLSRSRGLGAKP